MKIKFEHQYQQKIMQQSFEEKTVLQSREDVMKWKEQWGEQLSNWHSPYKAMIDCSNLVISSDARTQDIDFLIRYFKGFFMRKVHGFGFSKEQGHDFLPFEVEETFEQACDKIGGRRKNTSKNAESLRDLIQFENHFKQHVVELRFEDKVILKSSEDIDTLKSKLSNNLMQWHSPWNLLVDCSNLEVDPSLDQAFELLEKFFSGYFMKKLIGYQPANKDAHYPFKVYRSRHKAAAILEADGAYSGDLANCSTRKQST